MSETGRATVYLAIEGPDFSMARRCVLRQTPGAS